MMEKELYLKKLGTYTRLSTGLKAYLKFIARTESFSKFHKIKLAETLFGFLGYLTAGGARIFLYDEESEKEITIMFWMKDDCLADLKDTAGYLRGQLFIEFLEYSTVIFIPENHISNIRKLFPELIRLTSHLNAGATGSLILNLRGHKIMDADSRLDNLLKTYPDIFTKASVKDVASYLGIHSTTLSKMRNKKSK